MNNVIGVFVNGYDNKIDLAFINFENPKIVFDIIGNQIDVDRYTTVIVSDVCDFIVYMK